MIEIALLCLALNTYWEARDQSLAGQVAVAQVVMNRVADELYPDNVCDVIYDNKQFSWYWDGKADVPREEEAWMQAQLVASAVMAGSGHVELKGVTHYHAITVEPYWLIDMIQVAAIEDHIFYKVM